MKYRKRPVIIEAVQWLGNNFSEVGALSFDVRGPYGHENYFYLEIETLEGRMRADLGDWTIRGVQNEVYPCKPAIFEATYELVNEAE